MSMDKDEVEQLLNIANLSRQWPNLAPIHSAAMGKLEDHAKEAGEVIKKKREDEMKAKAEAEAKAQPKPEDKETKKWPEASSQSSAPTAPSLNPSVRRPVESSKQET